jgi:hypothetical protein
MVAENLAVGKLESADKAITFGVSHSIGGFVTRKPIWFHVL